MKTLLSLCNKPRLFTIYVSNNPCSANDLRDASSYSKCFFFHSPVFGRYFLQLYKIVGAQNVKYTYI